ncbi:MAG: hypothetical protein VCB24_00640 [Pseudomonas sp.]|uniref:hypothetical protein n=1 Tax=Pseudomonas sp. TaxID=306 RepID=UPI0039820C83
MKTIIASLILLLSSTAQAMTIENFNRNLQNNPEENKYYIIGLGTGYTWMNTYYKTQGITDTQIFCPPPKIALNADNYIALIQEQIKELNTYKTVDEVNAYPVEMLLLLSLQRSFPCP